MVGNPVVHYKDRPLSVVAVSPAAEKKQGYSIVFLEIE
jgi:hypothetical protein